MSKITEVCKRPLTVLQCNLARPSCAQCVRNGIECPGYRDPLDAVFVNENDIVKARTTRQRKSSTRSSSETSQAEQKDSRSKSSRRAKMSKKLQEFDISSQGTTPSPSPYPRFLPDNTPKSQSQPQYLPYELTIDNFDLACGSDNDAFSSMPYFPYLNGANSGQGQMSRDGSQSSYVDVAATKRDEILDPAYHMFSADFFNPLPPSEMTPPIDFQQQFMAMNDSYDIDAVPDMLTLQMDNLNAGWYHDGRMAFLQYSSSPDHIAAWANSDMHFESTKPHSVPFLLNDDAFIYEMTDLITDPWLRESGQKGNQHGSFDT